MLGPLIKIEGRMDGPMYRDIMENEMLPFARERMPEGWLYQQDNDPKHVSVDDGSSSAITRWSKIAPSGVVLH